LFKGKVDELAENGVI